MTNPSFTLYGNQIYNGQLTSNKLLPYYEGFMTVKFKDGFKLKFCLPILSMKGISLGSKRIKYIHSFAVIDEESQIMAVLTFHDGKKQNMFSKGQRVDKVTGNVYVYDPVIHQKTIKKSWYEFL